MKEQVTSLYEVYEEINAHAQTMQELAVQLAYDGSIMHIMLMMHTVII